jgi:hypothetical protein
MTISVDEGDQTRRKRPKINGGEFFTGAHNGLVAGSSPAGPTKKSILSRFHFIARRAPHQKRRALKFATLFRWPSNYLCTFDLARDLPF